MAAKVCRGVLLAMMALVSQLALGDLASQEVPSHRETWLIREAPALQGESGGAATHSCRSWVINALAWWSLHENGVLNNRVFQLYPIPGAPGGPGGCGGWGG